MLHRRTASGETAEAEAGDEEDSARGRLAGGGGGDDPERSSGEDSVNQDLVHLFIFIQKLRQLST